MRAFRLPIDQIIHLPSRYDLIVLEERAKIEQISLGAITCGEAVTDGEIKRPGRTAKNNDRMHHSLTAATKRTQIHSNEYK
jgi:hypothetical protein